LDFNVAVKSAMRLSRVRHHRRDLPGWLVAVLTDPPAPFGASQSHGLELVAPLGCQCERFGKGILGLPNRRLCGLRAFPTCLHPESAVIEKRRKQRYLRKILCEKLMPL